MPYIRCKLNKIVTDIPGQCEMKNIRYLGTDIPGQCNYRQFHYFQGVKNGANWGQNANYRQFHYGNAIYSLQVEQNRYISSLQIYLESVKCKIFVTGVTKHFQWVKKGAKWGKNANYRQFHYGNPIYSLRIEQNRYRSSLQIYMDSVKWKTFVTGVTMHFQGVKKGGEMGPKCNYRQFHYGNAIYSL